MSLRTFSQNKISTKRFNGTSIVYANYWDNYIAGATLELQGNGSGWKKIAKDSTGAVYIVGTTSLGSGGKDTFLMKFNTSGGLVWQRAFGAAGANDIGQAIVINSSDEIYISGYSGAATLGAFVAKYDTSGNLLAQIRPTSAASTNYIIMSMDVNNSTGDVYLTGQYTNASSVYYGLILRVDSSLSTILQARSWGTGTSGVNPYNYGIAVEQSTGNFYTCGYRQTGTAITVAKHTSDTSLTWSYTYNTGQACNIAIDGSGNIYVVGYYGTSSATTFLMKIDTSGNVVWSRRLTGTSTYGYGISFDLSNNIFISSGSGNTSAIPYAQYVFKFDSNGNLLWQNSFDSTATDGQGGILVDVQGNFYLPIAETTNNKVYLFHLPGTGAKNSATYTGAGISYDYYPSSLSNDTSGFTLTPTSFSATLNSLTISTGATYTSQSVSHTVSTLAI